MKLVDNKGKVLKHSSSLRMIEATIAISVLQIASDVLPAVKTWIPVDPVYLTIGAAVCGALAWGFRFIMQRAVSDEQA